ncbi:MAG: hypothetical protein K8S14_07690 [Actinomycetia bacterium]|nr:hypothetical protein [Actinomycetes bacterium]
MKKIARIRFAVIYVMLATLAAITSGFGGCNNCVLPGFVGVPEAIDRSPDYTLMLTPDDSTELHGYLALGGDRMALELGEVPDPGALQQIQAEYGLLLSRLSSAVPISTEDLEAGSSFRNLFDPKIGVLTVHDARVGWDEEGDFFDLVGNRIVALVSGDFVFAFYLRRLEDESVEIQPVSEEIDPLLVTVWYMTGTTDELLGQEPFTYTGLVVFRKVFAIPGKGH